MTDPLDPDLELLLARIREALATSARDLWTATAADPFARLGTEPPILVADATRAALARAGSPLLRLALGAAFSAADPARATPPSARTAATFTAAARSRATTATRLGFPDAWALALATAGDTDTPLPAPTASPAEPAPKVADDPALAAHLRDPFPLIYALAAHHGLDAAAITRVTITRTDAPEPGRSFVLAPDDIRLRIWQRPNTSVAGTLRVLLHEVGHAFLAMTTDLPARSLDEATAAWFASLLERPDFNRSLLGLAPALADALAASERAIRATRRARLLSTAASERAFYLSSGPPPWSHSLAWTDPGASHAYALAESIRDSLDSTLGPSWPTSRYVPPQRP